jgi:hypothetical protein
MKDATPRFAASEMPLPVQILSIIGFAAFSIVAVSLAFAATWIAGMVVAILLAMTWARNRAFGGSAAKGSVAHVVAEVVPNVATPRSSGNASFDAYREDTLRRLQEEQDDFETFLNRLRAARDQTEFDQFMDDRARSARAARDTKSA